MTDTLGTTWTAKPHTLVKHRILRRYLDAWFPILTRQAEILKQRFGSLNSREILFIDGFAGPGEYTGGEPGSPVIAIRSAIEHQISFPMPVRMLFIEHREDRFKRLETVVAPLIEEAQSSPNIRAIELRHGDCDAILNDMLNTYEHKQIKFGPALAFLDQFGYGEISMDLISRIMSYQQCEVFAYLNYKDMHRWMSDPNKAAPMNRAFGGDEWRECINMPEKAGRNRLLDLYKSALKQRAKAAYVISFLMFDKNDIPLYWLLFCTKSRRGAIEMKRAMRTVDKSGECRFSDRDDPGQLRLLEDAFDDEWLANELLSRLAGKTVTAALVEEFVVAETTCCYLFRGALKSLELADKIKVVGPPGRKKGSFKQQQLDAIKITFPNRLF